MAKISGGDRLKARLDEMARKVKVPATLGVGFLEGATYPDGTTVALVAAVNNFGSQFNPPRPFFSDMVREESPAWPASVGKKLKAADYNAVTALNFMGEEIKGELQQAIIDFVGVPLKPATIAAKGFEKQLIDSGHMLNSVDYEVTNNEES